MQIRQKLILGLSALCLLVAVIGGIAVLQNRVTQRHVRDLNEFSIALDESTNNMENALLSSQKAAHQILSESQQAIIKPGEKARSEYINKNVAKLLEIDLAEFEHNLTAAKANVEADLTESDTPGGDGNQIQEMNQLQQLADIKAEFAEYRHDLSDFTALAQYDVAGAHEVMGKKIEMRYSSTLLPMMEEFEKTAGLELIQDNANIDKSIGDVTRMLYISIGSALLLAAVVGFFISRSISNPIKKLKEAALEIGKGKLETRIDIKSGDELGTLAKVFNQMAEGLSHTTISIEFLNNILTSMMDTLVVVNKDLKIEKVNQAILDVLGYEESELKGKALELIFTKDSFIKKEFTDLAEKGSIKNVEKTYCAKNGREIPVSFSASIIRNDSGRQSQGIVCVAQDITERKQIENKLHTSEEWFKALLDASRDGIVVEDGEKIIYINKSYAQQLKYDNPAELIGKELSKILPPDEVRRLSDFGKRRLHGEQVPSLYKFHGLCKDGALIEVEGAISTYLIGGKKYIMTAIRDITEQKQAEQSLRNAQANYRNLVELSPAIIYSSEPSPPYTPLYVSPNILVFGYSPEEWLTQPELWSKVIHNEDRRRVLLVTEEAMKQGLDIELEYRIVACDGKIHWLQVKGGFVSNSQGHRTGWQAAMLDVTKTKQLEGQLRQSQKLESVGLLAGGIAHDFNNMLTAINGYSELILRKLKADDPLRSSIEQIKQAGRRSADLTQQLLAFSRQQILQPVVTNLNEIIIDTTKMLQRLIGEDIQLTTTLNSKIGQVKVDPGQFSQIIMNLAINAREAMPQGGRLTIETVNIFLDPAYCRRHLGILPGAYVLLAVSDTGLGISEETKRHIFEPFFTTKAVGVGTGLGLATVYGIVKQSGGHIEVYSEEGIGTTFKIYLPRVAELVEAPKIKDTFIDMPEGTETILLVEDEELVRKLSRSILETCGYTIIEAENGIEALEICEKENYQFDLLLTDVVMPQMGGRVLAEKLIEKLPNLQILFTSGYTDDAVVRHGVIETNTNFIQKPFTPEALAGKIRKILDDSDKI